MIKQQIDAEVIKRLDKITKSMLHGPLKNYPDVLQVLKDENLYYSGDEDQPVVRFIPEARIILAKYNEFYNKLKENDELS